jgi:carbonic anhydrase
MRTLLPVALLALGACHPTPGAAADAGGQVHWGYAGREGPEHWSELSPGFALCQQGHQQSPIDLHAGRLSARPAYRVDYTAIHPVERNNGHTIQVDVPAGSALMVGGERLELLQYHFHAPSEHTVDGVHLPAELHLVHRGPSGLSVLGVLIREGAASAAYEPLLRSLPSASGDQRVLAEEHRTASLLPSAGPGRVFRYAGSLTTPPCTEGVSWHVLTDPVELSASQIERLRSVLHDNARPVQPLHARALSLDVP